MHGQLRRWQRSRLQIALRCAAAGFLCLLPGRTLAQANLGPAGELVDSQVLRVCADPSDMPFSDAHEVGFENKIAQLAAERLGRSSVQYTWHPLVIGFVRNTLGAFRCDVIMGFAQGDELVQNTNAYYRSAYALVYRRNAGLDGIDTIEDPRLAGTRVGVVARTPPATNLAKAGLMRTAKVYPLMFDTRLLPSMGKVMIDDLLAGTIDVGALWGPMAGYYAARSGADLAVVPLVKEKTGSRMVYGITMGVRPSDQEWKRTLNRFIKDNQMEINRILLDYHVPLLDAQDRPLTQ